MKKKEKKTPEEEQKELLQLREDAKKRYLERQERLKQIQLEQNQIEIQSLHTEDEDLPEEVLLVIFSFLDLKTITNSICFVCRGWNKVQKNNIIWESLYKKTFKTVILSGKEEAEGVWKESFENRAKIRFNWYKNKSSGVVMDMKQEDYDTFKKATLFDGVLSIPKESLTSKNIRIPSYIYSISLFGDKIITGDQAGSINIWNCRTAQLHSVLNGKSGYITCTKMTKDKLFSSAASEKKVFVWDVNYGLVKQKLRSNSSDGNPLLKFDLYDKYLYGFSNFNAEIIDIENDKTVFSVANPHTQQFTVRGCHVFENLLVTCGYGDGLIQMYDTRVKVCVKKIKTNASTKIKNPQGVLYSSAPTIESKSRISAITSDYNTHHSLTTFDIGTGKEVRKVILGNSNLYNPIFEGYDDEKIIRTSAAGTAVHHRDTGNLESYINLGNYAASCDFDEGRIVFGCTNGSILYKNYGGSNFYWTGLGTGKTLGSSTEKKVEDKMEIEEVLQ